MEMTLKKALNLFELFKALNGSNKIVNSQGQDTVALVPYQFDSKTVWNVSKNLNVLRHHVEDNEAATKMLLTQKGIDPNSKTTPQSLVKEFNDEVEKIQNEKINVEGLLKIKLSGLKLDTNPISPGLIADLADWIEE